MSQPCGQKCDVYSRVVGYFQPVGNWNVGKKEEYKMRKTYDLSKIPMDEFTVVEEKEEQVYNKEVSAFTVH
jgi:hypothetical protein